MFDNLIDRLDRSFRLLKDGLAEKSGEFVDNGTTKARYRKTGKLAV